MSTPTAAHGNPPTSASLPAVQMTLSATAIATDAPSQPTPELAATVPVPDPYSYLVSSSEIATTRKNPGYKSIHASQAQQ